MKQIFEDFLTVFKKLIYKPCVSAFLCLRLTGLFVTRFCFRLLEMCYSSCRLRFGECTKLTRRDHVAEEIQIAQNRDTTLEELLRMVSA